MNTKDRISFLRTWVLNLKQVNWKQGKGVLEAEEEGGESRYCCLGVLGELFPGVLKKREPGSCALSYYSGFVDSPMKSAYFLPEDVTEKMLGLSREDVTVLMKMNDIGISFQEIAKYIENTIIPRIEREEDNDVSGDSGELQVN